MAIRRIQDLPGLGPTSEAQLAEVGVLSVGQFLAEDPFEIYRKLKKQSSSVSLNFLYAMIGAQENRTWQSVASEDRTQILMRLDDMGLAPK